MFPKCDGFGNFTDGNNCFCPILQRRNERARRAQDVKDHARGCAQVRLGNLTIPITTTLRAIASRTAVLDATPELTSSEYADNTVEIGGDQISYGQGGPVMVESQVVGRYTSQGVLANVDQDSATAQAFWLFSVNARGAYGFRDLTILQSGRTEPFGEVTLASNGMAVKVDKDSAMLLRVDGSGPEEAQARTTLSRETRQ